MTNSIEDKNRNFRTILFLLLFHLLLWSSQNIQGIHNTSVRKVSAQTEFFTEGFLNQHNAVLCQAFSFPDLFKFSVSAPNQTNLIPFSVRNKISDYNRRITLSFIIINKVRLSAEPNSQIYFYSHLPSNRDDDLPVLS